VIFEPHARVGRGPVAIGGLWKQCVRWARGSIQITRRFRHLWFRPQAGHRLGSAGFGLFWFSQLLLPFMMICASASLITLFFIDYQLAWAAFHVLWITNVITYVFITSYTLLMDPSAGKYVWRAALIFPGVTDMLPRPDYDDEVKADIKYERGLAVKAAVAIALVLVVILVRTLFC
jgi:hypothetical protein